MKTPTVFRVIVVALSIAIFTGCGGEDESSNSNNGGGGGSDPCQIIIDGHGNPEAGFSYIPPYGSFNNLEGFISHAKPKEYYVVVYIKVNGSWWIKPYYSTPFTAIRCDGSWTVDITTGGIDERATEIVAYLVPVALATSYDKFYIESVSTMRVKALRSEDGRIHVVYEDNRICELVVGGAGIPEINFSYVPSYGSFYSLQGYVSHIRPLDYYVVVYIKVGGVWWVKPYYGSPFTPINCDGSWMTDITTVGIDERATEIVAYLVPINLATSYDMFYIDEVAVDAISVLR